LIPCIQRQISRSVRAQIKKKKKEGSLCSLLSATSLHRPVSQSTWLFVLLRAQWSRTVIPHSLHSIITRRIVWRSAERCSSMPILGHIGPRRERRRFLPIVSGTACVRVYRREASRAINRPRPRPSSPRTRCRRRGSAWLCASVPAGARCIRLGRSSHHCGTGDKGALNILKSATHRVCPLAQSLLPHDDAIFSLDMHAVYVLYMFQRCVLPRAMCVGYTWFWIHACGKKMKVNLLWSSIFWRKFFTRKKSFYHKESLSYLYVLE